MNQYKFDQHVKQHTDTYDANHNAKLDTDELWNNINNKLHPRLKLGWFYVVSAAAIILFLLNIAQFLATQQYKKELNRTIVSQHNLENEIQIAKDLLKVTSEEKEKYSAQVSSLQEQQNLLENRLLTESKKNTISHPKTLTKYIITAPIQESEIDEKQLISKPKVFDIPLQENLAVNDKDEGFQQNTQTATSMGVSTNHAPFKNEDKPLFRIRFGNNYKNIENNFKSEPQTGKKLAIKTFL